MKRLLIGVALLNSLSASAVENKFPMPCEVVCTQARREALPYYDRVRVSWNKGHYDAMYALVDRGTNVKEFIYDHAALSAQKVDVYKSYGDDGSLITLALPGKAGDLSSLPIEVSELMITEDELFARPEFSLKGSQECEILAYSLNGSSQIVSQVLESETDKIVDTDHESPEVKVINQDSNARSKYYQMSFEVITNISKVIPSAKNQLLARLTELQKIGVCKKYVEGR